MFKIYIYLKLKIFPPLYFLFCNYNYNCKGAISHVYRSSAPTVRSPNDCQRIGITGTCPAVPFSIKVLKIS